jgi:hypothetical protein
MRVDVAALGARYIVEDPERVGRYLEANAFLVPLLLDAAVEIRGVFGGETRIRLELSPDPEASDGDQLFAVIETRQPMDEARRNLRVLDNGWWRTVVRQTRGKLSTDVEATGGL